MNIEEIEQGREDGNKQEGIDQLYERKKQISSNSISRSAMFSMTCGVSSTALMKLH